MWGICSRREIVTAVTGVFDLWLCTTTRCNGIRTRANRITSPSITIWWRPGHESWVMTWLWHTSCVSFWCRVRGRRVRMYFELDMAIACCHYIYQTVSECKLIRLRVVSSFHSLVAFMLSKFYHFPFCAPWICSFDRFFLLNFFSLLAVVFVRCIRCQERPSDFVIVATMMRIKRWQQIMIKHTKSNFVVAILWISRNSVRRINF